MDCDAFERWLDEGEPQDGADVAHAHAAECLRCATTWRASQSLEHALAATPASAPAGFTERVMARVGKGRVRVPITLPALPWWVRAAMEPATVLAMLVAGGLVWGWDALSALAPVIRSVVGRGASWQAGSAELSGAVGLAVYVTLALLFALSGRGLARTVGRLTARIH